MEWVSGWKWGRVYIFLFLFTCNPLSLLLKGCKGGLDEQCWELVVYDGVPTSHPCTLLFFFFFYWEGNVYRIEGGFGHKFYYVILFKYKLHVYMYGVFLCSVCVNKVVSVWNWRKINFQDKLLYLNFYFCFIIFFFVMSNKGRKSFF